MKGNINVLADSVFAAVKGYCDVALRRLLQLEIEPIKRRLDELPVPKDGRDGRDAEPVDMVALSAQIAAAAAAAAAALPPAAPGRDGRDGKDADIDGVRSLVDEFVAKAISGLPVPKDGRDGRDGESVDAKQVASDVTERVLQALSELPPPLPGKDGRDGVDGRDGLNGKDADPDVISALVEKLVQDAIDALPPARDGKDGVDGKDAKPEQIRLEVERAIAALPKAADGIDGVDGRDGRDGKDGAPGRDALQIDILPAIDLTRSYPRSTYAQWGGGIIRSTRTTEPVPDGGLLTDCGWTFLVRGISMIDIQQTGEREFEFRVLYNDGTTENKGFRVESQIYRGVHVDGKQYERGDTVTWAGAVWHCNAPTSERPGDGSTFWRLAVKRGRDGKDGKDGMAEPRKPSTVKL